MRPKPAPILIGMIAFATYWTRLPSTVQLGDTAELVANAYALQISHPSGYPLFTWLEFFFTHAFSFGSVFLRASIFNALCASIGLGLLAATGRRKWISAAVALCLAFSSVFWKYSELPDVYALNSLLAAGFLWVYCNEGLSRGRRTTLATLIFCLGLANHLTFLFLAPLLVHVWIESRKEFRHSFMAVTLGTGILAGLYASLLLMHPSNYYSWGNIRDARGVVSHLLREDYSRNTRIAPIAPIATRLVTPPKPGQPIQVHRQFWNELHSGAGQLEHPWSWKAVSYWRSFLLRSGEDLFPVFALLALGLFLRKKRRGKPVLLALCGFLYALVMFALIQIDPGPVALEVVERFFILPQILFCFAAIESDPELPVQWAAPAIFLVFAVSNSIRNGVDYSKNTIVEDYALNQLSAAPAHSMILTENDTEYFALRYAQQILGKNPDALVVSAPLFFHPWYLAKIQNRDPRFRLNHKPGQIQLEEDLLDPNLDHLSFVVPEAYADSTRYKITQLALGKLIEKGSGLGFDDSAESRFVFRSGSNAIATPFSEYDPFRAIYARYAYFHLARGIADYKKRDLAGASAEFVATLKAVPYCVPAISNLCSIRGSVTGDTSCGLASQNWLPNSLYDYFDSERNSRSF